MNLRCIFAIAIAVVCTAALCAGCSPRPVGDQRGGDDMGPTTDDDLAGGDDAPTTTTSCEGEPLAAEVVEELLLAPHRTGLQPGEQERFETVTEEWWTKQVIAACVTWSVEPAIGAAIDDEGLLTIDETVSHGARFTVHADVEDGRRLLTAQVFIYTPEQNPLVGMWQEVALLPCDGPEAQNPIDRLIREVVFDAGGLFSVAWDPEEGYIDYWGRYTYDPARGTLRLEIDGGNYVPAYTDLDGTVSLGHEGEVDLVDVWFGSELAVPHGCGHRLRRLWEKAPWRGPPYP